MSQTTSTTPDETTNEQLSFAQMAMEAATEAVATERQRLLADLAIKGASPKPRTTAAVAKAARAFPARPSSCASVKVVAELQAKGFDQRWLGPEAVAAFTATLSAMPAGLRILAPGIGRGLWLAPLAAQHHITGIEIDADVADLARIVLPDAAILTDDFAMHDDAETTGKFDVVIGCPPTNCLMEAAMPDLPIQRADGTVLSQHLWAEQAIHAARSGGLIVLIVPADEPTKFLKALSYRIGRIGTVLLPPDAASDGTPLAAHVFYVGSFPVAVQEATTEKHRKPVAAATTAALPTAFQTIFASPRGTSALKTLAAFAVPAEAPLVLTRREQRVKPVPQLPVTAAVEVRIIPNGGHIVLVPNGQQAALRIAALHAESGVIRDGRRSRPGHAGSGRFTRFSEMLREPFEMVGPDLCETLRRAGIVPVLTTDQATRLARRSRWIDRMLSPFEQTVRTGDGAWVEQYTTTGVRASCAAMYAEGQAKLRALGFADHMFPYQADDTARLYCKPRALLGSAVGVGKSIELIALSAIRATRTTAVVCESKLIDKWSDELTFWQDRLPNVDLSYRVVRTLSDIGTVRDGQLLDYSKLKAVRFLLIGYESLWRVPADSAYAGPVTTERRVVRNTADRGHVVEQVAFWHIAKHSLAAYLRPAMRRAAVYADEAHKLQDDRSKCTTALMHLGGRVRIAATATPIKNYVTDLMPVLNWLGGERSAIYRNFGSFRQGEQEQFTQAFATFVHYRTNDDDEIESRKMIPKIANVGAFRTMTAPIILRRSKLEPSVQPFCNARKPLMLRESIPMDPAHHDFYREIQGNFTRWWEQYQTACHRSGKMPMGSAILAKLIPLAQASGAPHKASLQIVGEGGFAYHGGLTAKQRRTVEICDLHAARGEKIIVFVQTKEAIPVLQNALGHLNPVVVTGDVSLTRSKKNPVSRRHRDLLDFRRNPDRHVLIASTPAICTGSDIFEASISVAYEQSWTPSEDEQARGRMLRPQQKKQVICYSLTHAGTIDEYRALLSDAKADAVAEGLDDDALMNDLALLPDIRDYANHVCAGRTIDSLRPARVITKVVSGGRTIWTADMGVAQIRSLLSDDAAVEAAPDPAVPVRPGGRRALARAQAA